MKRIFPFILALILTACGGKQATELSPVLVLNGSLVTEGGLTGGIMIYGTNSTNGDHFAKLYDGNDVLLSNGDWTFSAVGWDGDDTIDTGHPMVGTAMCAVTSASLQGGEETITFSMSTSNCLNSNFGPAKSKEASGNFRPSKLLSCSDEQPLMFSDPTMCTGTGPNVGVGKSYKISLTERLPDGSTSAGLISECVNNNTSNANSSPRIPMFPPSINAPVSIKTFDVTNCGAGDTQVKTFANGLLAALPNKLSMSLNNGGDNIALLNHDTCSFTAGNASPPHSVDGGNTMIICNTNQVVVDIPSSPSLNYILERDLDFSSSPFTDTATVAATFTGVFDGRGHTISNLSFTSNGVNQMGFFQAIDSAEVIDVNFQNVTFDITDSSFHGTLAGIINDTTGSTRVDRVSVDGVTFELNGTALKEGLGGVVGQMGTTTTGFTKIRDMSVKNAIFNINNDNVHRLGGILGVTTSDGTAGGTLEIARALVNGIAINQTVASVPSATMYGGIFGGILAANVNADHHLNIFDAKVTSLRFGSLTGERLDASRVGGVAGRYPSPTGNGEISEAKVSGEIYTDSTTQYVGGAIGDMINTPIRNLIVDVTVDSLGDNVGGAFGMTGINGMNPANFSIDRLRVTGDVRCRDVCGGLFGLYKEMATWGLSYNMDFYQSFFMGNVTLLDTGANGGAGGFAGHINPNDNESVISFFESGTVNANVTADNIDVGGLIGRVDFAPVNLENVLVRTTLNDGPAGATPDNLGGVVGTTANAPIIDLYKTVVDSTVSFTLPTNYARIIGNNVTGTCSAASSGFFSSLAVAQGTGNDCTLASPGDAFTSSDFTAVNGTIGTLTTDIWGDDSSSQANLRLYNQLEEVSLTELGTELDPFLINTSSEWNSIGDNPFFMARAFRLGADLDFNSASFIPLGSRSSCFHGTLQGNNKTMFNINLNEGGSAAQQPLGIIRHLCEPQVFKIQLGANEAANFAIGDYVTTNSTGNATGVVTRIDITNDLIFVKTAVGAFAISDNLDNAYPYAATVATIAAAPTLMYDERAGNVAHHGIGKNSGTTLNISNITLEGSPDGETGALAGLISDSSYGARIENINVTGAVITSNTTTKPSGGVIGLFNANTLDSGLHDISFSGSVISNADNSQGIGGIVGEISGTMGSMVTFRHLFNRGTVDTTGTVSTRVGGVVGNLSNSFIEIVVATNTGDITGDQNVGGIVGYMQGGRIMETFSKSSTITATSNYAGGLIGSMFGTSDLVDSYSESSVDSAADAGGLIGNVSTFGTIARNYTNSPSVTGAGTIGTNYSHYIPSAPGGTNNYFTSELTGEPTSAGQYEEVTDAQLLDPATMGALNSGTEFSFIISDQNPPRLWYEVYPQYLNEDGQ